MNLRRVAAAVAVAAGASTLVPLGAAPAGAVSEPEVVADGLNNPYKLAFGPDGHLYVAESGTGGEAGSDDCVDIQGPEDDEPTSTCVGDTGSVTRIDLSGEEPEQERVVEGLASYAGAESEGSGAIGPTSVTVGEDGTMYVTLGLGGDVEFRESLGDGAAQLGTIVRVPTAGAPTILSDLVAFEAAEDPDVDEPRADPEEPTVDSNPFDIEMGPEGLLAADAGGNDILAVDPTSGATTVAAVLPFGEAPLPPFIPAPPGTMTPVQSVPTGISIGEAGVLVSELTGFPFPVGGASIVAIDGDEVTPVEEGFTNIIDVAQAADGTLYVLEFASEGLLNAPEAAPPTSRLIQVRTDGTRKVLLQDELFLPAGVVVGPDDMVYVTNGSQTAGGGTVIRVDPTVARDAATAAACDPTLVLGSGFGDVGGDTHRESIDCLAWWGLILGVDEDTFAPNQGVVRAQVATILLGVLEAAGVEVPAEPADAFDDDEGNVHEGSMNALAALGVLSGTGERTVDPNANVSRGQLASMMAAAYEAATGEALPAGEDAFDDDDTSVHQDNINAVAAAGWITGKAEGSFAPSDPTTRGQLASLVARMLSTLVDEGLAEVPAAG